MWGDVLSRTMSPCHMMMCSVSLFNNMLSAFELGTCVCGQTQGIQQERERSHSNCCYLCPEQQLSRTDLYFNPDLTDTLGCGSALEKWMGRDSWSLRRFHDTCYTDSIPCEI